MSAARFVLIGMEELVSECPAFEGNAAAPGFMRIVCNRATGDSACHSDSGVIRKNRRAYPADCANMKILRVP